MKIREYLEMYGRELTTCSPDDSVPRIAAMLGGKNACALPVCDADDKMIGIVSERDVVRSIGEKGHDTLELSARDIMTENVITCGPDDPISKARQIMHDKGFRNVPIVEDNTVIGVIGVRDALKTRLDQKELEVNVLKDTVIAARNR